MFYKKGERWQYFHSHEGRGQAFRRLWQWAIITDRNMSHPRLPSAIKLLGELIAFNTQSVKSNLLLVEHVGDYLQGIDIKSAVRLD